MERLYTDVGMPIAVSLVRGSHLIECWGAQGSRDAYSGKGAYVRGIIHLRSTLNVFIYNGEAGKNESPTTFNGGGAGQSTGGGATDVRLQPGEWSDFSSLKSRIIVAGGGGGSDTGDSGGNGGTLSGFSSSMLHGKGGSQTRGGEGHSPGKFGKGGGRDVFDGSGNGGGGSGYYGGGSSNSATDYAGGGGSSFISGYYGCNAILSESEENHVLPSNQSIHYSGYFFENGSMIDGYSEMPSPNGANTIGHMGSGCVRITYLGIRPIISCNSHNSWKLPISVFLVSLYLQAIYIRS